jgi:hypothetical protein
MSFSARLNELDPSLRHWGMLKNSPGGISGCASLLLECE